MDRIKLAFHILLVSIINTVLNIGIICVFDICYEYSMMSDNIRLLASVFGSLTSLVILYYLSNVPEIISDLVDKINKTTKT